MEMEQLGLKLQDFESEALYEFEELQTELLETRGIMEELQRKLGDSERKRVQEQKLKIELELQLLRLSDESQGSPGGRASHAERSHGDEDWMHHGMSRASSVNLMEQPGTPEQREQEAASHMGSYSIRAGSHASRHSSDQDALVGMEDIALALAQLREDYRNITTELVEKKMELALSEEAQLNLIERFHRRQTPRSPSSLSCTLWPSLWRTAGAAYKAVENHTSK